MVASIFLIFMKLLVFNLIIFPASLKYNKIQIVGRLKYTPWFVPVVYEAFFTSVNQSLSVKNKVILSSEEPTGKTLVMPSLINFGIS